MTDSEKNRNRIVQRVSPIFEKVFSPSGEGFSGFTIFFGKDEFTNHILFFEKANHAQVSKQVEALREDYCRSCPGCHAEKVHEDNKEAMRMNCASDPCLIREEAQ